MQDTLKEIYELAIKEQPLHYHDFPNEEAVMYRGFKISKSKKGYKWEDTRYSNYYEKVDPKITKNVLKSGFSVTLNLVRLHNDKEKIVLINRRIIEINKDIQIWSKESTRIWNEYKSILRTVDSDKKINSKTKKKKKHNAKSKYETDRALFQKRRRILGEEKDELKSDLNFFKTRSKTYNN